MKMQLKRLLAVMLIVVLAASLTACGGFDASAYVKGTLDGVFHGEANADYLKMTGETEADVTNAHESVLRNNADMICEGLGVESIISEEGYEKIVDMSRILYSKVKYTVGKATKVSDGYEVALTIEPVYFDTDAMDSKWAEQDKVFEDKINSGEYSFENEADVEKLMAEMIEVLTSLYVEQANESGNLPAVETTVKLVNNNNVVSLADGELERLESIMVSTS